MIAFDRRFGEFQKRDVQVLGVSIDAIETHKAWRDTDPDDGGIGAVQYPLISDEDRALTKAYDVEHADTTFAMRGAFLIDKDGTVQHQVVNNMPLGRDVDELLRIVDALQFHEKEGEVCPAGWAPGKQGMTPSEDGVKQYLQQNADKL